MQVLRETVYQHFEVLLVIDDICDGCGMLRILTHCLHELWATVFSRSWARGSRIVSGDRIEQVRLASQKCLLHVCILWLQQEKMRQTQRSACRKRPSSILWGPFSGKCCHSICWQRLLRKRGRESFSRSPIFSLRCVNTDFQQCGFGSRVVFSVEGGATCWWGVVKARARCSFVSAVVRDSRGSLQSNPVDSVEPGGPALS